MLRPRSDTDLLVREGDLETVVRVFRELGYDGPDVRTAILTSYESLYGRKDSLGRHYYFDVHWKINNAQLFANTFTFDELSAESIGIPMLASCARGLGYTHALLLACIHRFAHAHAPFYVGGNELYAGDHLRWVYDIHLLCSTLDTNRWSAFISLARTKGIAEFCIDGLTTAIEAFNTQIPAGVMDALQTAARDEASSATRLRASETAWFIANLRALPGWRQKISFIKQIALPSPTYMMEKYHTSNPLVFPFLYGHRAVNGFVKRLRRPKSQR
jgi:hypothetical protein